MRIRQGLIASVIAGSAILAATACTKSGSDPSAAAFTRTADGKPDFNGIWQAMNSASYNIEDHSAELDSPGGLGIVDGGGEIPYRPEALVKRKTNHENKATLDPQSKCYLPGVPRAMYLPFPFQIAQSSSHLILGFEYAAASRIIYTDGSAHPESVDAWMGDSRGRWEGDTLVVDVRDFNDATWFDGAGNYHSDALHVVERFTPIDRTHMAYEATIEDPNVFTRPWKIRFPLYRNIESKPQLVEYRCVEFLEPLRYQELTKPGTPRQGAK